MIFVERSSPKRSRSQLIRYGFGADADFCAEDIRIRAGETKFRRRTPHGSVEIRSPLTGRVNVYNLLAAFRSSTGHAALRSTRLLGPLPQERRSRDALRWSHPTRG